MTRLAKAVSALTNGSSDSVAADCDTRSFAGRGASLDADGSGAAAIGAHHDVGRWISVGVALVMLATLFALLFASSASATKYVDRVIGATNGGTGLGGHFANPRDIAVNVTGAGPADAGDFYVADSSRNRIQRFDATGNFERAWGANVLGRDEVQTVTVSATAGTYTLTFEGSTTTPIAFNATAATVDNALDVLGSIGTDARVTVTGSTGGPYTVTFAAEKGGTDWAQMTANAAGLSGGSASVTVNTVENGAGGPGADFEICTTASLCRPGTPSAGNAANNLNNGAMNGPHGVAVNQTTGDVYVRDRGNNRVNQYDGDGNFIRSWGWDVDATVAGTFEICPAANRCKAGTSGTGDGQFASNSQDSSGIAIEASTGDVFVVDPQNRRIQRFQSNGTFVSKFGSAAQFTQGITPSSPAHIAVAANGIVYAGDDADIERYDLGTGTFLTPISRAIYPASSGNVVGLEFDPVSSRLLVARPDVTLEVVNPSTTPAVADTHVPVKLGTSGTQGLGFNSASGDLIVSSTNFVYIADDDGAPSATMTILPPTAVTTNTATLHGEVGSPGLLSSGWELQISLDGVEWETVSSGTVAAGGSAAVSGNAIGLRPNAEYRTRIVTQKEFGNPKVASAELNFLTDPAPPEIRTTSAQDVTETGATLTARINPFSTATAYHVEWGNGAFTNVTPVPDASIGSGPDFIPVSQQLAGLAAGTTYQFRFVATSSEGLTTGPTMTFTTLPSGGAGSSTERSYELVSPPDKVGGVGVGPWYKGPGAATFAGVAAHEGERFAAQGEYGSMLMGDAAQAFVNDWAFAERISDSAGWVSHSPITHASSARQEYRWVNMQTATPDLSRVGFFSNGGLLKPFPEMAGWSDGGGNLSFLADWDGRWEIFGPTDYEDPASQLVGSPGGAVVQLVISADGSTMVGSTSRLRGLEGPGDPTLALPPTEMIRNVYVADASSPADNLPGTGTRTLASVCAGSTTVPAVDGGGDLSGQACADGSLVSSLGAAQGADFANDARTSRSNVVSRDGSRIFFMSPDPGANGVPTGTGSSFCDSPGETCPTQLYVRWRQASGAVVTRWISRSRSVDLGNGTYGGAPIAGQDATLLGQALYEGASEDGDRVFFRTNSPLTPDDPNGGPQAPGGVLTGNASSSSWDLYMYDFPDDPNADPGDGTLTRISAGPTGASDANNPQSSSFAAGQLRFVSEDGSRLYFVTAAPLAGVAVPTNGTIAAPEGTVSTTDRLNLYSYDSSAPLAARWRFVTRVFSASQGVRGCVTSNTGSGPIVGAPTPVNTEIFDLMPGSNSCVSGTADGGFITFFTADRLIADDSGGTYDIYAYDADRDDLTRITATQGVAGGTYLCGSSLCNGDGGFSVGITGSGNVPNPHLGVATDPLTEGERLAFFQSRSRLVAEDTDSAFDVYQWRNGKLSLLTPGDSPADEGQMYKGNDETGRNVYFATMDQMSWQDYDAVLDVYSARVGNGVIQPLSPPACSVLADACQGAQSSPPVYAGAGSAAFSGDGNVIEKKKQKKPKKKGKKKKRKGKGKDAQRANHDRRTSR